MSNPRSSRRTCARVATFHVDDEIEVSSSLWQSDSLDDGASGAGPPALSLQGNVDLAEAPGSIAYSGNALVNPTFNVDCFAHSVMSSKRVTSKHSWVLIGKAFYYKELERDDDLERKSNNKSNAFVTHSLIVYDGKSKAFLKSSVRCATRSLRFLFYSVDSVDEHEVAPVASFHPNLTEGARLYALQRSEDVDQNAHDHAVALDDAPFSLMQGVLDDDSIALSSPAQTGVLLSFAPPATSYACAAAS